MKLTHESHNHLRSLTHGNPLMQTIPPEHVRKELISAGVVRQTIGGCLKATDEGMMLMHERKR